MAGEFTGRQGSRPPAPGSRLAGYVLEEQIGAGGMAIVFRARDEMLGRLAAVKVIAPAMAGDTEFRARFLRESRAIAAVEEPHIIPVYAAGEADSVLYIATRYVAGGDLVGLLQRAGGILQPDQAADLVSQVAAALDAAHAAGLVHRDVKPANILIDAAPGRTEHAFLSDFGLSKGASSSTGLTATGQFLGTPDYCAPEQVRGGAMDGRLDQYALACVAFVLLTGTLPFRRGDAMATLFAHVHDPVPAASVSRAGLSPALDAVLARGMAKAPADRFASCGEFAAALRAALAPATLLATPTPGLTWQPGAASAPASTQLSASPPARTAATGDPRLMAGGATVGVTATPRGPAVPGNAPAARPAAAPRPPAAPRQAEWPRWKSRQGGVEWRPILIGAGVVLLLAAMEVVQHVWHVWG
jgi:serine/threonine-protein kinase